MVAVLLAIGAIVSWWLEGWKANESGREMGWLDVREFLARVSWRRGQGGVVWRGGGRLVLLVVWEKEL